MSLENTLHTLHAFLFAIRPKLVALAFSGFISVSLSASLPYVLSEAGQILFVAPSQQSDSSYKQAAQPVLCVSIQ